MVRRRLNSNSPHSLEQTWKIFRKLNHHVGILVQMQYSQELLSTVQQARVSKNHFLMNHFKKRHTLNLSWPIGGFPYGMPRKASTSFPSSRIKAFPCTFPDFVSTTRLGTQEYPLQTRDIAAPIFLRINNEFKHNLQDDHKISEITAINWHLSSYKLIKNTNKPLIDSWRFYVYIFRN